jgi:hypothetical protein
MAAISACLPANQLLVKYTTLEVGGYLDDSFDINVNCTRHDFGFPRGILVLLDLLALLP